MKDRNNPLESIIMVIIFLVMVQTFLDDLSVILDWSWSLRKILLISGFCFDAIFTLEFFTRLFRAIAKGPGHVKEYFLRNRGWIDLAASVPLLLFSSGPAFFSLFTGMVIGGFFGVLNVLKVVKAVRIARILRLLRVLKVFKQIKFTDSKMVQRHSAKIVTTVVTSIILPVTLMSFLFSIISINDVEKHFSSSHLSMAQYVAHNQDLIANPGELELYAEKQSSFLLIRHNGELLYSRYDQDYYDKYYYPSDYAYLEEGDFQFFIDLKPLGRRQAWDNISVFVTVIMVILILMIFYSPHFAITVSDPINIMKKGMSEKNYHLEVAIPSELKDDDMFQLAQKYNEEYLPLKMRNQGDEGPELELSMDDMEDIFDI